MKTCNCDTQKFVEYKLKNGKYIHMPKNPDNNAPHIFDPNTGIRRQITMAEAFKIS